MTDQDLKRKKQRAEALRRRDAIPPIEGEHRSKIIAESVISHLASRKARFVHCYISFKSEVGTRELISQMLQSGIRVAVPIVGPEEMGDHLIHVEITSLDDLVSSRLGIHEPKHRDEIDVQSLDAVLLPVVAFDRRGMRLGYGRGFYDRFLSKLNEDVERVGLAFSEQECDEIAHFGHDERLDRVMTEKEVIVCKTTTKES